MSSRRRSFHRVALYLGLIDTARADDGLTYRQRLRVNWQRKWRPTWPVGLWFLIVFIVWPLARWYVSALVAVGLGVVFLVIAVLRLNRRDRRRTAADPQAASRRRQSTDR